MFSLKKNSYEYQRMYATCLVYTKYAINKENKLHTLTKHKSSKINKQDNIEIFLKIFLRFILHDLIL